MERLKDVSWSCNMKRAYRQACHDRAIQRQDRIFEFYGMVRQKIVGCLVSLISMAIWIWFTLYDVKLIWWGCELFPLMMIGFYIMLTDKRLFKDLEDGIRKEKMDGTGYMESTRDI